MENLYNKRKVYDKFQLVENQLLENPIDFFKEWMQEAEENIGVIEANAMNVSTVDADGCPRSRVVLLKAYSEEGFIFYTNYESNKGKAIAHTPKACLHFFWPSLERQVMIKATLEKTSKEDSETYFHSRPKGSQLGALASHQSRVIESREVLQEALKHFEAEFENKEIPKPDYWGGYVAKPYEIEFWQGRPNRLHDRIRYLLEDNQWKIDRVAP
ncbi:pyridoxamine 5'-phosphate oxidase [Elizabethkingia sp. JS20170427COW]|uniref:pyridoxamine 5'-phosphate oxidase n=1 Tax=Elizabethkingia sp. JS20170427COW TaxID=2583851 RepID=UPI0011105169|nr:pyridoxamine 5'-phosphate oxidase [Elizabethkingia sp. JS20170427COW]QCX53576.1 pyridoxamine 5'-phosphate oxidase [Elizabethkingia sp. JS20170427COW]